MFFTLSVWYSENSSETNQRIHAKYSLVTYAIYPGVYRNSVFKSLLHLFVYIFQKNYVYQRA